VFEKMAQQEQRKIDREAEKCPANNTAVVSSDESKKAVSSVKEGLNLGKLVPLVDVSGSMSGEPKQVAIALGTLVSEINHPSFRDRVITFHSDPTWCDLSDCEGKIVQKVSKMKSAPWGLNTDLEKAFQLILDVVVANKLPVEEVPDLIIFSDMQFDAAITEHYYPDKRSSLKTPKKTKETQLMRIQNMFHDAGIVHFFLILRFVPF
jgi:uncharacterized protein with von Willebrand factor type A (vWA) domain